ncbi:hypothetical protein B1R94_28385 [Mycolicibacterium litorale]|nr:hypothetical protein B1R94_28385 [Mycolicibacterium litorale]
MTESVWIDGAEVALPSSGTASLWDVLDETSTAPPFGCGTGHCGACTVLVDGIPAPSCVVPKAAVRGSVVSTVQSGPLQDLVDALAREGAVQCGFCSPGIVVTLSWALREAAAQRRCLQPAEVREHLVGHLCRCTGYQAIVAATVAVSAALLATTGPPA